jgi:HSP20 family protein
MTNLTLKRAPWRSPFSTLLDADLFGPSPGRMLDWPRMRDSSVTVGMMPPVEVAENDKEFICTAELPGVAEKDVEIAFETNELTIKGEKREEKETESNGSRYHTVERTYGAFNRTFMFPVEIDSAKVSAEFRNGVLTVRLPKMHAEKKGMRKIPVVTK